MMSALFPRKNHAENRMENSIFPRVLLGLAVASGGVVLALLFCSISPAAAQIAPPTPLPQVVATQQAASTAAAQVSDLQAKRAQTEAQLAEINRNIEAQIAEAERAAADARNAAATQNAVEAGAAIGRLEGAIAQLRASYAGKDAIIGDLTARIDQLSAQVASQQRTVDGLNLQVQQAVNDKRTAISAYNAVVSQRQNNQQNDMVSNAVWLIVALAFLCGMIALTAYMVQRRRAVGTVESIESSVIDAEALSVEGDQEPS